METENNPPNIPLGGGKSYTCGNRGSKIRNSTMRDNRVVVVFINSDSDDNKHGGHGTGGDTGSSSHRVDTKLVLPISADSKWDDRVPV